MALNFVKIDGDTAAQGTSTRPAAVKGKARADAVIDYIQTLIVPSGEGQGERFRVRDWQERFIRDVYEPHDPVTGRRLVRRAILSMGRKNGKTALIACLVLAHLDGPEAVKHGEIYSAANDREQAAIIYKYCEQIVLADEKLFVRVKLLPSSKTIKHFGNGSIYKAVTAESGTKHGLNPTVVIYDELAQAKTRNLYDVLDTSMGAQREPLFISISTQSHDPEHQFSTLIDDAKRGLDPRIICHLYEVPLEVEDIYNPDCWHLANPALGDFRDLEDLRAIADKAKRMPAEQPKFRNLYLNQRVSLTSSLITREDWLSCSGPANFEPGEAVWLALDLSATVDLTALVMGSNTDVTRIRPYIYKPNQTIREHSDRDFGAGNAKYQQWAREGHLYLSPGRTIHPEMIARKIAELCGEYKVLGLIYDRWGMASLLREFDRIGLAAYADTADKKPGASGLRLIPWGQGYKDMSPAVKALETAVLNKQLEHPSNPLLNWTISNAIVTTDPSGNRKLDKEKAKFRIDPVVALAMLLGAKAQHRELTPSYNMAFL